MGTASPPEAQHRGCRRPVARGRHARQDPGAMNSRSRPDEYDQAVISNLYAQRGPERARPPSHLIARGHYPPCERFTRSNSTLSAAREWPAS